MTPREQALTDALKSQAQWVRHWLTDKQCRLTPTDGSMQRALDEINRVI